MRHRGEAKTLTWTVQDQDARNHSRRSASINPINPRLSNPIVEGSGAEVVRSASEKVTE